jgi:chromosome segregation ATPase
MSLNLFNQPATLRSALVVLVGLLLLGVGLWGTWRILGRSGPATYSSRQAKAAVGHYLKKKTGKAAFQPDYDLQARQTLADLQTNALRLRQQMAELQTNSSALNREMAALRRELATAQDEPRALRRQIANLEQDVTAWQKRLAARQEDFTLAQSNAWQRSRGTEALASTSAPPVLSAAASNRLAALQASLTAAETNLDAARRMVAEKSAALAGLQEKVATREAALAAKQQALAPLQATLQARQNELAALQKELNAKERQVSSQFSDFSRQTRRAAAEATSYKTLYELIGRHLALAEKLLAARQFESNRTALTLAREAVEIATDPTEDPWLAARICQAYLWPNLEMADPPGRPPENAEALLQTCQAAFVRAGETNHVIQNYRLALQHAATERRRDLARYYLAFTLEQTGELHEAAQLYRQVQDSNLVAQAARRLTVVERKLQTPQQPGQ